MFAKITRMKEYKQQEINLINIIEIISKKSAKSNLNPEKLVTIKDEVTMLADYLKINHIQAILFACILNLSLTNRTNIAALSRHFRCSSLKMA